jgi:hypothetical protein
VGKEFGFVFGGERFYFVEEGGLSGCVEWWRWGGAGCYGDADLGEELFLTGGRTDAEEADGLVADVVELVGSVGGDVDCLAGLSGGFYAAEGGFDFAVEENEGLFEVVTVRGRAAVGRDVHVDEAEAAGGVVAGEKDGVGVADEADVGEGGVIGYGGGEGAGEVIGGKLRSRGHRGSLLRDSW